MIYFFADYSEREELLNMGAKWDFGRFMWYVEDFNDYKKFEKWIIGKVVSDELYILEIDDTCPFCGAKVKLLGLGCGEYTENLLPIKFGKNHVNLFYGLEHIPVQLEEFLRTKYKIKNRFSVAYGFEYPLNGCDNCGEVFVDSYLFDELESPFLIDSRQKAEKVKLNKIELGEDLAMGGLVCWSIGNNLFDEKKIKIIDRERAIKFNDW